MHINTNRWNKVRYTLYTPIYDLVAKVFKNSRRKSIEFLEIEANHKILIVGAGTGLDLEFLHKGCEVFATDITPSMIERIKHRNQKLNLNLKAMVMDGQALEFDDDTFDVVILHLILAVIPDPIACIKEAERVLKKGGKVAVFDKFVRKGKKASIFRRAANVLTNFLFSDITRDFKSMVEVTELRVVSDTEADFHGNFRVIGLVL